MDDKYQENYIENCSPIPQEEQKLLLQHTDVCSYWEQASGARLRHLCLWAERVDVLGIGQVQPEFTF